MQTSLCPRRWAWYLLFVVVSMAAGCGTPRGEVSGVVKYKGKPLSAGTVAFFDKDNRPVTSQITAEGIYHMYKVPVGLARITVSTPAAVDNSRSQMPKGMKVPEGMPGIPPQFQGVAIPDRYNDAEKSGLTLEVQKGGQTYDINLD